MAICTARTGYRFKRGHLFCVSNHDCCARVGLTEAAVISIYRAIYTLAAVRASYTMVSEIDGTVTPLHGFIVSFKIIASILMASGVLGLM